ncbi:MAG: EAL domain-containing protein [Clostridia bacterium]|nr:EAL domain-containing protein [Clostridia bacterium]
MGQEEIKRAFKSIEEAFEALPQHEREHCIRVAHYAEAIFLQACAADIYSEDNKARLRLKPDLRERVANAARYMNIGKALVPELYHQFRPDFTPEEIALFRKHTTDGAKLAASLLTESPGRNQTEPNIIMEAIESHHEQWNGGGFPSGTRESETPIMGRIVAVAAALDRVAVQKHSEQPFEYAVEQIIAGSGTLYDPVLVSVVADSKLKLKRTFTKFIHQSRTIPPTEPVIRRRASRPFSLWYRPVADVKRKKTAAFEAEMRFRDREKSWISYQEVEHIVKHEGLLFDLGVYFLMELCDTLKRLDACQIPAEYIAFAPPPGWLNHRGLYKEIASILEDARTEAPRLCIVVTADMWAAKTKTMQENLKKISSLSCLIMFSGFGADEITAEELKESGAHFFRLGPEAGPKLQDRQTTEYLAGISSAGIVLMADGMEKNRHVAMFGRNKIAYATSALIGDYQPEDDFVENELALLDA